VKSERLRKLESELRDLEQWQELGLVPKKDLEHHQEEIRLLKERIEEERERLQFLKEGGEAEEFIVPKRVAGKPGFSDVPTVPDMEVGGESGSGMTDSGFDMETYVTEDTTSVRDSEAEVLSSVEDISGVEEAALEDRTRTEEDESYFSDKNRWRRGGIRDPDADEW